MPTTTPPGIHSCRRRHPSPGTGTCPRSSGDGEPRGSLQHRGDLDGHRGLAGADHRGLLLERRAVGVVVEEAAPLQFQVLRHRVGPARVREDASAGDHLVVEVGRLGVDRAPGPARSRSAGSPTASARRARSATMPFFFSLSQTVSSSDQVGRRLDAGRRRRPSCCRSRRARWCRPRRCRSCRPAGTRALKPVGTFCVQDWSLRSASRPALRELDHRHRAAVARVDRVQVGGVARRELGAERGLQLVGG